MKSQKERRRSGQGAAPTTSNKASTNSSIRKKAHAVNYEYSPFIFIAQRGLGEYICVSRGRRGPNDRRARSWRDKWFKRDQAAEIEAYVETHAPTENIYVTPNTFCSENRQKGNEAGTTVFYADLDYCDPSKLPAQWRPHLAWETSPGKFQAVWLLPNTRWNGF